MSKVELLSLSVSAANQAEILAKRNLSHTLRFQSPQYQHATTRFLLRSPGYNRTKINNRVPLYEAPQQLDINSIAAQWINALVSYHVPTVTEYTEPYLTNDEGGVITDTDEVLSYFIISTLTHQYGSYTYHGVKIIDGIEPTNAEFQENVYEHSKDIEDWIIRLHTLKLLPQNLNLEKAITLARIHDLGEAIHGDIAAYKGKKTKKQQKQEVIDCLHIIAQQVPDRKIQKLLQEYYLEYEEKQSLEAIVVNLVDKFCGTLVHIHSELNLSEQVLQFSYQRIYDAYQRLENLHIPNYNPKLLLQMFLSYLVPDGNWIRFFYAHPEIYTPPLIEF